MKILIVDDEDLIRRALERILSQKNHLVTGAENGVKALQILDLNKDIDLVILDLLMPEKNGFEVLAEMNAEIPVIVISAFTGTKSENIQSDEYPNVIGFIKKPFEHIQTTIDSIEKLYANHIGKI